MKFTPSEIIQYLYCPRFTYFEYVLRIPQNEDKYFKVVKGREMHNEKLERNKDYLRKKIGVVKKYPNQYLAVEGLRGVVDEVLELKDGSFAPLDYKFAQWKDKVYNTYKYQLYAYGVMIEEVFSGAKVDKGYLVYIRSKHKLVEVTIPKEAKAEIKKAVVEMGKIIQKNYYPAATKIKKRCYECTYRNICPK